MDRLPRNLAACGLGLLFTAAGCRSTRPEVPPGRPFSNDGRQRKAIEFSSEGHPTSASASVNFLPNHTGRDKLAAGIGAGASRPDAVAFGAPPGAYGPPGSAGLGRPPALDTAPIDPAAIPAATTPPPTSPPAEMPPVGFPPAPELGTTPPSEAPAPSQAIPGPLEAPGTMGSPDQMPSPN